MDLNITSSDMVLDTRTPPRVRQQQQQKREKMEEVIENSHAGVAIPIDEESIMLEEEKKMHFYKVDRPTTDSGLSTWILLSGHTSSPTSTAKVSRKPSIKNNQNMTIVITENNKIKPLFKKKLPTSTSTTTTTTTVKPSPITTAKALTTKKTLTTTLKKVTAPIYNTKTSPKPEKATPTKLTKIKASLLNNSTLIKKKQSSTTTTLKPSTSALKFATSSTNTATKSTTEKSIELIKVSDSNTLQSNNLPLEAKDDEIDIDTGATTPVNSKKTRRPTNKRKKNKNRRKRPSAEKTDVSSNNTKVSTKEKPIGTQIYNYLSREVMPTVGVGLVGLMVTAGLASYFLYPFGALRRSYDVDRKDKDNSYYYRNEYNGGIAEEEAIGKVIAGMPTFSNYNNYKTNPISNVLNSNVRYRHSQQPTSSAATSYNHQPSNVYKNHQTSMESVKFNNKGKNEEIVVQNMYVPQETYSNLYTKDVMTDNKDKFVVGNVPKEYLEEVTPVAVPEHGPRSMKFKTRRRRQIDYNENDVFSNEITSLNYNDVSTTKYATDVPKYSPDSTQYLPDSLDTTNNLSESTEKLPENNETFSEATSTKSPTTTEKYNTTTPVTQKQTFLELFRDVLHLKIKMGLELLQNTTQTLSRYISRIQKRVEEKHL